ncbi:hypothetical protein BDY19DRAFT_275486 [Irpex rosettiformis]|uniref:Uncharacterized protein n=1 Tax=Irpex rosettiformis TaxID=378272 RepID=A0ACB8UHH0_9APHY|nr:hypothetical protein BDY19DRAFT_275486 [Irpex rosettiformis]
MTPTLSGKDSADDGDEPLMTTKKLTVVSEQPVRQSTAPTKSATEPAHDSQPAQPVSGAAESASKDTNTGEGKPGSAHESEKKKGKRRASSPSGDKGPFPTVPTSVSATGPRSAHVEGKNFICITRKTPLGMYLRRCKDVVLKDGHKTLHLNAMGAAIPHLLQLALSLPEILPYSEDEIKTEVQTGTVQVQDEVIPDDEDEDISIRTRGKSTLSVVITIGDGIDEGPRTGKGRKKVVKPREAGSGRGKASAGAKGKKAGTGEQKPKAGPSNVEQIVIREEDMHR